MTDAEAYAEMDRQIAGALAAPTGYAARTAQINKLQRHYPGTRRQRGSHGAGKYSVQFFDKITGELKAWIEL